MKYVLSPNTKYSLLPDRVLIKHDGHIFTLSGDQLKLIKTIIASFELYKDRMLNTTRDGLISLVSKLDLKNISIMEVE